MAKKKRIDEFEALLDTTHANFSRADNHKALGGLLASCGVDIDGGISPGLSRDLIEWMDKNCKKPKED